MPCQDSSSGLNIRLNPDEKLLSFDFSKISCSSTIEADTGLKGFCKGKTLEWVLDLDFSMVRSALNAAEGEQSFILYLELDALKSGIAQYLGIDHPSVDRERCLISSIEVTEDHIDIYEVILPPKDLPPITACHLNE